MIRRSNLPGLAAGVLATAIVTTLLYGLPEAFPSDAIDTVIFRLTGEVPSGNPFRQFRLFGGLPGGIVAGAMVRDAFGRPDTSTSVKYGVLAALLGLLAAYLLSVSLAIALGFPPLPLVLLPLFALMVPAYFLGGIAGAFLGVWLGRRGLSDHAVG